MNRINNSLIITSTVLLVFLAACSATEQETTTENGTRVRVVAVETMEVKTTRFEDRIRINGNVDAYEDALISVETAGQVRYVADRGQQVKKGDVIVRLDDTLLKASFQAAKTGYDLANDVYKRQAALYADSVISTLQYLQTKAQRDQAAAQLAAIEKQLADSELRAPFDGRIEDRLTNVGQFVGPGTPVLRLVNTAKVKITGGVPERFAGLITQGTDVEVNFRSYDIQSKKANVRFAGNIINPDSRTFPVEVVLDNNGGNIKPRMVVEMRVLRNNFEDVMVIPRTAVQRDENNLTVFVVRSENGHQIGVQTPIELSFTSGDFAVVRSGLQAGDHIVTGGFTALNDGDRLNTIATRDILDLLNLGTP